MILGASHAPPTGRSTPANDLHRAREADRAGDELLVAVGRWRALASALAETGYGEKDQREGLRLLQAALPFGDEPREEDVVALHAWMLEQHERALGAEMKLSHLIALGVAERWVRPIPEQSGIVLKRVRS